jgi:hypothetical protein
MRHSHPRLAGTVCRLIGFAAMLCALATTAFGQFSGQNAATVVVADGNVSVLRDENIWALFPGNDVRVGETIVTGEDGYAELAVSDGSSFTVYPNSKVVFRKNPGSLRDLVDVFLGRIKIHIQKLEGRPNPYRIFTPTAVISVRGTTFDVMVDDSETTVVIVDEGLVGVSHRLLPSTRDVEVGAGESLVIERYVPLARARVDKSRVVQVAGDVARGLGQILNRVGGNGGSSGGGSGGGGTPLPGDTETEPPPPPPPPPQ